VFLCVTREKEDKMGKKRVKSKRPINPVEEYKKKIGKYLVLNESHDYIDFVWGVVYANRLDTEPVWAYLIGPSSAGKTTILDPMNGHESIVCIDTLSKASLLPGYSVGRPKKEDEKKRLKNSLLAMAHEKILVIQDLSPLLTEDYRELKSILGILRSAYGGKFSKSFGNIGRVEIDCRFGLIAAVTDAIDQHAVMDSELGQRFIGYRMPAISIREEFNICDAILNHKKSELDKLLHEAAYEMLDRHPERHPPSITKKQSQIIMQTAVVVVKARTGVKRTKYNRDPVIARSERLSRLFTQLVNLAKGVAMARGHRKVMGEDVAFVRHVAAHTLTLDALRLLNMFVDKGGLTVGDLHRRFGWCAKTCYERLNNFELIGVCGTEQIAGDKGRDETMWVLKRPDQWEKMLRKLDYDVAYKGDKSRVGKKVKF
jgi:hypothetical protein